MLQIIALWMMATIGVNINRALWILLHEGATLPSDATPWR